MKTLKTKIQSWLNIESKQEIFRHFDSSQFTEQKIRPIVGEAIKALLEGGSVNGWTFDSKYSETLQSIIKKGVADQINEIVKDETAKLIKGEDFIDRIVKRIKDKQIN